MRLLYLEMNDFKYTAKEEDRIGEILTELFRYKSNESLLLDVTGVISYDTMELAAEYQNTLIEKCDDSPVRTQGVLEKKLEDMRTSIVAGSRFPSDNFSMAFDFEPATLLFGEILYWAEKQGYDYSLVRTATAFESIKELIVGCEGYEAVRKTAKYLQEAEADTLLDDMGCFSKYKDTWERAKRESEIEDMKNQKISPVPIMTFDRITDELLTSNNFSAGVISEHMHLFVVPTGIPVGCYLENELYAYKEGSQEIHQLDLSETFLGSIKTLLNFKSYMQRSSF